jgi:hypothetical protein
MKTRFSIAILLTTILALSSCSTSETYTIQGWEVEVNSSEGAISFANNELGTVIDNVKLGLSSENDQQQSNKWKSKSENDILTISTLNPKTEWTIKITETAIDFSCSSSNGLVTGIAPAAEKRIPARVKE